MKLQVHGQASPTGTIRYRSPNSRLSQEELDRLRECIEEANRLLRTLGNPRDDENLTQLRLRFRSLCGALVKAEIDCGGADQNHITVEVVGMLETAGRDFIQLQAVGERKLVPFARLCSLQHDEHASRMRAAICEPLLDIDPCLRRDLVLCFGETVACRPELLNRFLGAPLFLQLLAFVGCPVTVRLDRDDLEDAFVRGTLVDAKEDRIRLEARKKEDEDDRLECVDIALADICFLTIHSEPMKPVAGKHDDHEEPHPEEPHDEEPH
ncbi:hypothetical protein [Paenibacillus sp.]|uniref:hypothetical protein n=1 Tax=Paenibacillus sp. TaxID=58172 RepID=UPI002D5D7A13|nr:hypothetical protein [Paenibacillus sp.]HZG83489.1 hypothetical protein [Paenibacillus sp.]